VRLTKSISALFALVLAFGLALLGTGSASAAGPAYVALGDSYSAGNGAGNYISASGDCHQSNSAYPALWHAAHTQYTFNFAACSGAVTTDVINSQLGSLNASTTLVSITIGGNDAGFSDVMTTCVTGSDSTCTNRVATAENYVRTTLPGKLDAVYDAISAKAPSARVVVLGYPRIYTLNTFCIGISDTKHRAIDEAADLIDTTTASVAAAHGFVWGDVRPTFNGHELCSGDDWLHDLALPTWESYHPTAAGHSGGYLPVMTANA
jgi:lysophospholipase L1-like esterase